MKALGSIWHASRLTCLTATILILGGCTEDESPEERATDASVGATTGASPDSGDRTGPADGGSRSEGKDGGTTAHQSSDAGTLCCEAVPVCGPGEETHPSLEACEAAGGDCTENTLCCEAVYCRQTECAGTLVLDATGCQADGYCYRLPSDEYCAGPLGSCDAGSRPIAADEPCPTNHTCGDQPDGQRCAMRTFESEKACLKEGDYATPPIGALVPCEEGDVTLGGVSGFEPSACCLDVDGDRSSKHCGAMDARGTGECLAFFGWAWDGEACVAHSGCSCEGSDCERTYDSMDACQRVYMEAGCLEPDCRVTGCPDDQSCELCWTNYGCGTPGWGTTC